jgi:hypothetical protein
MWSSNSVIKLHSTTGLGAGKGGKKHAFMVTPLYQIYDTLNPGKSYLSVHEKTPPGKRLRKRRK